MSPRADNPGLRRILAADAVWDVTLGVAICALPWLGEPLTGLPLRPWWPWFILVGGGSILFGIVLARAARGIDSLQTCTAAAIANALSAAALIVAVGLLPWLNNATGAALLLIALVCGGFAFLEWRQVR